MRVLILENDPNRIEQLTSYFGEDEVVVATEVAKALILFQGSDFNLVLLDHHIATYKSIDDMINGGHLTGLDMAKVIAKRKPKPPFAVITHTWNSVAAADIEECLTKAGVVNIYLPLDEKVFPKAVANFRLQVNRQNP